MEPVEPRRRYTPRESVRVNVLWHKKKRLDEKGREGHQPILGIPGAVDVCDAGLRSFIGKDLKIQFNILSLAPRALPMTKHDAARKDASPGSPAQCHEPPEITFW
jgi:hypothetical protein